MSRKLPSWLNGLNQYVENTEAPRQFWLWAGISTIASALQRKVWLPFGIETYYPNLYILIVGPPASRKALPVGLSKDLLIQIETPVSKDSSSKRAFTKELAETGKTEIFMLNGTRTGQCAISVISKEMSSLLAVNPKEMIEVLTDLYDSHDRWQYGTSGQGEDILFNVCVNCLIATTPTWFSANLPQEAIGGGYTSRHVIVYGNQVYKRVPRPTITKEQKTLFKILVSDLAHISTLTGRFKWTSAAETLFDSWYKQIDNKIKETHDERLHPFIGRMHTMVLKTSMCLQVSTSDELILSEGIMQTAITMLEDVLSTASEAFGGHGRSRTALDVERVKGQLRILKVTNTMELLRLNVRHLNQTELKEVLGTLQGMGLITLVFENRTNKVEVRWLGEGREDL